MVLTPKALLKAAARAGSFFPEELLYLNPLASNYILFAWLRRQHSLLYQVFLSTVSNVR